MEFFAKCVVTLLKVYFVMLLGDQSIRVRKFFFFSSEVHGPKWTGYFEVVFILVEEGKRIVPLEAPAVFEPKNINR